MQINKLPHPQESRALGIGLNDLVLMRPPIDSDDTEVWQPLLQINNGS